MSAVCITYDERDAVRARQLAQLLRDAGVSVLLPDRDANSATVSAAFHQAIDSASVVLMLLTRQSAQSDDVARDLRRASGRGKVVALIQAEPVTPGQAIQDVVGLPHALSWNPLDADSGAKVAGSVKLLVDRLSAVAPPSPPRASTNATADTPPGMPRVTPATPTPLEPAATPARVEPSHISTAISADAPVAPSPVLPTPTPPPLPRPAPVPASAGTTATPTIDPPASRETGSGVEPGVDDASEPFATVISRFGDGLSDLRETASVDAAPRPGVLAKIDRFEIIRVLGQGGMGVVLLARDPKTNQQVAVKTIAPKYVGNERANSRFAKEAANMRRMQHPAILKVTEVVNRPNGAYYVMPYVGGGSLARMLDASRQVDESTIVRIAIQVADALRYAHDEAGVIHRDIKPENVLIDEGGNAFVSDFGLVRSLLVNETVPELDRGWTVGTARYMAPEIADGRAGDTRADIYSFGAMLYELACGKAPYEDLAAGEQNHRILERIRAGAPTPVSTMNPSLSADLVTVIQGAMARELRDRYAHMKDVLEDLKRITLNVGVRGPHDVQTAQASTGSGMLVIPPSRTQSRGSGFKWVAGLLCLGLLVGGGAGTYYTFAGATTQPSNDGGATSRPADGGQRADGGAGSGSPHASDNGSNSEDKKQPGDASASVKGTNDKGAAAKEPANKTPPAANNPPAKKTDVEFAIEDIESGDEDAAIARLRGMGQVNSADLKTEINMPLLHKAALHNRLKVIRYLVKDRGLDINALDPGTNKTAYDMINRDVAPGDTVARTLRNEFGAKSASELKR